MIYSNPKIIAIPNAVGLDKAIGEIQASIAQIAYVEKVFGRANIFKEEVNGKLLTLPKVYQGENEYYNPLPNGNFKSSVFFIANGPEQSVEFDQFQESNTFTRDVSLIFWGNLKEIDSSKDYVFTETIKFDFIKALKFCKCFMSLNTFVDERYSDVFKEFETYVSSILKDNSKAEIETQYLMYPYSGFRMNITILYDQPC